jgi:adenine/guanine phosphoribosyltransferase-like PRPP-binding protein
MLVDHLVYYLIHQEGMQWRDQDWRALGVVKCVKNEPYKGTFEVNLGGEKGTYSLATRDQFLRALWPHMAQRISAKLGGIQATIVPIPNSAATKISATEYQTLNYARAIAASSGGKLTAMDALRWETEQEPQHRKSGRRDPEVRYNNMTVIAQPKEPVILFDDFITSGASLIAGVWRLREKGVEPERAFVIGRNTHVQEEHMTRWGSEDLPIPSPPLF